MFERYAIYCTFAGELGKQGASWLGYDVALGRAVAHPRVETFDIAQATARPRPYGFHATIKAPFRLAAAETEMSLKAAFEGFCMSQRPAACDGLSVSQIGRFLALTCVGDMGEVQELAGNVVRTFDPFRAPLTEQEIAKRSPARLSEEQRSNLMRWGYPHVMEAFKFHVTLTGPLKDAVRVHAKAAAEAHFDPVLPAPFVIPKLTLVGQRKGGVFQEILKQPLLA